MKFSTILLTSCLVLLLANSFYAQSEYLAKGESGIGFIYSYGRNNIVSGNSLGAGYSLNGILDFDFSFTFGKSQLVNFNGFNETSDVNYTAIQPSISYYFIKPDSTRKSGICITLAYESTTYNYDSGAYYFQGDKNSSATLLALTFYGERKNRLINILPSFTAGSLFDNGDVKLVIGVGLGMKFNASDKIGAFISPSVSFYPLTAPSAYNAKYSFSLTTGLLFNIE
jgi:hypothetical protein